MGQTNFLAGGPPANPHDIGDAIETLNASSKIFTANWETDFNEAGRASQQAMLCFDHIVGEILRQRDEQRNNPEYLNSTFKELLDFNKVGKMSPVSTIDEQQALTKSGAGNGKLPPGEVPLSFEKILTKIKHRKPEVINFRVENKSKHFFLAAINHLRGGNPDCIIEFCVADFIEHCVKIRKLPYFS